MTERCILIVLINIIKQGKRLNKLQFHIGIVISQVTIPLKHHRVHRCNVCVFITVFGFFHPDLLAYLYFKLGFPMKDFHCFLISSNKQSYIYFS